MDFTRFSTNSLFTGRTWSSLICRQEREISASPAMVLKKIQFINDFLLQLTDVGFTVSCNSADLLLWLSFCYFRSLQVANTVKQFDPNIRRKEIRGHLRSSQNYISLYFHIKDKQRIDCRQIFQQNFVPTNWYQELLFPKHQNHLCLTQSYENWKFQNIS